MNLVGTKYEPYLLQLHTNISYYSLLKLEWGADRLIVKRAIQLLNDHIFPQYEDTENEFIDKQWTDFCTIRRVFYNNVKTQEYNKLRMYTRELNIKKIDILKIWTPINLLVIHKFIISLH